MTSIHSSPLHSLSDAGVSVWLDDLGRDRLVTGELARLVADGVKGVTTNPSIFAAAVSTGSAYAEQLAALGRPVTRTRSARPHGVRRPRRL